MDIILQPSSNIDLKLAAVLRENISKLAQQHYQHWFIDLDRVASIGNAGLLTLLEAHRFALQTGRQMTLFNLRASVMYLLRVTELDRELDIAETVDRGLARVPVIVF